MKKNFSIFFSILSLLISSLAIVLSFADIDSKKLEFNSSAFLTVTGAIMSAVGFVLGVYFALLAVKAYGDIKKIEDQAKTIENHKTNIDNHAATIDGHNENINNHVKTIEGHCTKIGQQAKTIQEQVKKSQKLTQEIETINGSIKQQVDKIQKLAQKAELSYDSIGSILNSHEYHYLMTVEYQMELNSIQRSSLAQESPGYQDLFKILSENWTHLTRMRAKMAYFFPHLEIDKRKQFLVELGGLGDREDLPHLKKILESENETDDFKEIVEITIQNISDRLQSKSSS